MQIKKHAELKYCEFATKIQKAAMKTALEGTALVIATGMIIKSTGEKIISGDEYSINPLLPSDTSVSSHGGSLWNTELGRETPE